LEVVLVLVLLGVLLALAMPSLQGTVQAHSMTESCERLRTLIHLTRNAAMHDGVRYRLSFPGAPDPDDPDAERLVETPEATQQPVVSKEYDPVLQPGEYAEVDLGYDVGAILLPGLRCVAVRWGGPSFELNLSAPFAGPEINAYEAPFDTVTFNPDGTCDWATLTLTDLPLDAEPEEKDIGRIINIILDGRTGQVWYQRPLRNEEVELLAEYGASPLLHMDFTDTREITEDNILQIQMPIQRAAVRGGGGG
jgi:type II secretory pathway pseudopilin PulG